MNAKTVTTIAATLLIALAGLAACDRLTTELPDPGDRFDGPSDGLTSAELALFVRGDAEFERRFTAADGLGPLFNNVSCASCHSGDGRGRLENSLHRVGTVADEFLGGLGPQIQDKGIPGAEPKRVPAGTAVSSRLPPPVFGVGLIEAIPESAVLAHADPDDRDGDGISGRANWVIPPGFVPASQPGSGTDLTLGRFGRKAQMSSILQTVAQAYREDIGITSDFFPTENRNPLASAPVEALDHVPDPEILASTVLAVTHYVRALAAAAPGAMTAQRQQGATAFDQARCSACHVPVMRTGQSVLPALSSRDVPLFSDLLLHDMGDGLADNRPDGSASGREWRTAPLWGLRLASQFLNGQTLLLHDGRAHSIEEAITMHGGEAQRSRDAFAALSPDMKRALVDYVGSR